MNKSRAPPYSENPTTLYYSLPSPAEKLIRVKEKLFETYKGEYSNDNPDAIRNRGHNDPEA